MFAADAKAFLSIHYPVVFGNAIAQKNIFELHHPGIGKEQGRVIFKHQWSGRHNLVALAFKKF